MPGGFCGLYRNTRGARVAREHDTRRQLLHNLQQLPGARAFPGAQYRAGIMPALTAGVSFLFKSFLSF